MLKYHLKLLIFFVPFALLSLVFVRPIFAQNADFLISNSVCINQALQIENTTTGSSDYIWDFCHKDLSFDPLVSLQIKIPNAGSNQFIGIRTIFDQGEWLVFVADYGGARLLRLEFGSDIDSQPQIFDLGNLGGFISGPITFDFLNEADTWYAIIANGNSLVRAKFGNGLKMPPSSIGVISNVGVLNNPFDIKIVNTGTKILVYVSNFSGNNISIVDFGNSIQNTPFANKTISVGSGFSNPWGIDIQKEGDNWYGLVSSVGNGSIYRMDFGLDPYSTPAFVKIGSIADAVEIELFKEGLEYVAIVRGRYDGFYRITLGPSMSSASPVVDYIGTFGLLTSESRCMSIIRHSPGWMGFSIEFTTGNLFRLNFSGNCAPEVSQNSVTESQPSNIYYKQPGSYLVDLTAIAVDGTRNSISKSLTVSNLVAPAIEFISVNSCLTSSIDFIGQDPTGANFTSWLWDFGDSQTANIQTSSHQYSDQGTYDVKLTANSPDGCISRITKPVLVYQEPQAAFNPPIISGESCTLQNYVFTNQSTFDPLINPTWTWSVDGIVKSNAQNLDFNFDQPDTYSIELTAEIPGCSNSFSQNFIIDEVGILVDFSFDNLCMGDETIFTNASIGTAIGFNWNFDDGQSTNQTSPSHTFQSIGSFDVTLEATNASGCTNSKTETVVITSAPSPDFFIDLPPFSCSETPTQFHDATPPPPDGNIVSWNWSFDDAGSSSTQRNPQHTYAQAGIYQVALQVETNFGCQSTIQIPVEISESLDADFSVGPACLQKGTEFQSLVLGDVLSWRWSIDNSFYSFPDPVHTFSLPGNHQATLIVVGANGCEALATKNITIHPAPLLDFSTSAACTDAETIFTDMTTGVDMPANWSWILNGQESATGSPSAITFESSGIKPIKMLVTTAAGCEYSLTKNVVVSPSPIASFAPSTTFGAPPMLVQFNNTSVNASSYTWDFGISNATSTEINPNFSFNELGDYLVELTASNGAGCSDTFSQTFNVLVPMYSLTLENLLISESLSSSAKTPVITIKNNSNVLVAGTDVWVTGSNGLRLKSHIDLNLLPNASTEVEVPIQIFSNEDFLCVELDLFGDVNLSDNSSCQNLTDKPVLLAPYPNPTSGTLWFDVVMNEPAMGTLKIADSMGKTVFSQHFSELSTGMNRIQIDFKNQSPGAYLAIWEVNGKTSMFRFLAH